MLKAETARREAAEAVRCARLLKWLRREVNRDLREWRGHLKAGAAGPLADRLPDLVADCKAKLAMIAWAESWQNVWTEEYAVGSSGHDIRPEMIERLRFVMYGIQKVAAGYTGREGYREEAASEPSA